MKRAKLKVRRKVRRATQFPRTARIRPVSGMVSIKAFVRAMDAASLKDGRDWANEYHKSGPDGRQFPGGDSFGFLYNHLKNTRYLELYCRYVGVSEARIDAALEHANQAISPQSGGKLFREILPWRDIARDAQEFVVRHLGTK